MKIHTDILSNFNVKLILVAAVFIGLSGCAGSGGWDNELQWETLGLSEIPGEEEYPDAGAIVLFDEGEMSLSAGGEVQFSTFKRHRVVKILNNRGHIYANVVIPYSPQNDIKNIRARTISPDGEVTELEEEDIFDVTMFADFIWYSDQRAKRFTMPAVEDGAIVEYSYELEVGTLTYMHSWTFQESVPTLLTRFTLNNPSELDLKYQTYGIDIEPEVNTAPSGFNSSYTWEARNMPAVEAEVGMPPSSDVVARLALAPIGVETWDDVASWYHDLITPRMQADRQLKSLAEELTADADSDYDKLNALFTWVRDQVRYIAVSIGIGGYQPHHVDDIFRNQYGDCKYMVTLLVTMANEIGIESYQALTSTFQNGVPDTTLPSPYHFNHVIAYAPNVGENGIWMDPTEKGSEFSQLPWYDQGTPVLKVGENGEGTIIVTPVDSPGENRKVMNWNVELAADGSAKVSGSRKLWGANAAEFREDLMNASHTRQKRWLETELAQMVSGAVLDSFSISGLEPIINPLTIEFEFHTSNFAKVRDDQLIFEPGDITGLGLPSLFASRERTHPIRFSYGFQKDVSLAIHFPEEWEVSTAGKLDSVSSDFGKVEWNWYSDDQVFHANVSYLLEGNTIYPSRYSDFRAYLDEVRQRDLREITFTRRQRAAADEKEEGRLATN